MAIPVNFNGRRVIEPGVYSQIKSGVPAKQPVVTFGNLLLIDTGNFESEQASGSGSGIIGGFSNGLESVYGFDNINDFKGFMKSGVFYDVADYIFNPSNSSDDRGPGMVYYVKAAKTTSPTISLKLVDATIQIKTKNEGELYNGAEINNVLYKGYSAVVTKGEIDNTKYIVSFYEGNYKGRTYSGELIDGYDKGEIAPTLLSKSIEFLTYEEFNTWANSDSNFNKLFSIYDYEISVNDLTNLIGKNTLSIGGSSIFDSEALEAVLETSKEIDNEFFLTDKYGEDVKSIENFKINEFLKEKREYQKFLIVGGGNTSQDFDTDQFSSVQTAEAFDSPNVILTHGSVKRMNMISKKEEVLPSFYYAANLAGRLGGLQPQEPITYKKLKVSNFVHNLTEKQREKALQKGVVHNRLVSDLGSVVNQGINTLQKNTQLFNPDGSSYEISIMRISSFLNKELVRVLRPLFIGNNVMKASPEDVKLAVVNYLRSRCATPQNDNLIINFENVTVKFQEDYYDIQYGFYPNGPVNKIFLTGFMLDFNAIL
jgi:hypothetical protein